MWLRADSYPAGMCFLGLFLVTRLVFPWWPFCHVEWVYAIALLSAGHAEPDASLKTATGCRMLAIDDSLRTH